MAEGENPSISEALGRKEKRKSAKKLKRKQKRREIALKEREEEETRLNDPEEQLRLKLEEQEEAERMERERKEFEERERLWLEAVAARKAEEDERLKLLEESQRNKQQENYLVEEDDGEYAEDGPAEIIWQGNEIIVKKKRIKVASRSADRQPGNEDADRPTSNPLPPQSAAFDTYRNTPSVSAQGVFASVAQQTPNFGTEQDKAHCPFHIKTGVCRFGSRCSRVHFHPDKSCTLLIKNMYSGPGLAWEQDEGLEYTDEEVDCCYEEFYEDVHTEFLKFGEIINFKVCRNGSFHLRGNVYVHYKSLESAVLAYTSLNGRYFAGKQITCEFIGVTRWKIAICGEYMKSRLKTCSRGSACNFIHCFRNPGGDYEWADWDNPPPKYWVKKMAVLFGPSDEMECERHMELDNQERARNSSRKRTAGYCSRRSRSGEDCWNSSGDYSDENSGRCTSVSSRRRRSSSRREASFRSKHDQFEGKDNFDHGKHRTYNSGRDYYDENRDHSFSHSRAQLNSQKKDIGSPDGDDHSEDEYSSFDYTLEKKYRTFDRDSSGDYSDMDKKRNRGKSKVHSGSRKKEANAPRENKKIEEKYDTCDYHRYQENHSSGSDYSGVNRDHHSSHLNRSARLTRKRRHTDFPDDHEEFEQKCDLEEPELYDGKDRSPGRSTGGEDDNGSGARHHKHSRKKGRSSRWKKELSSIDEHEKSEEKYISDDGELCNRRYKSKDCHPGRHYSDVGKSKHSNRSSRRVHTGRRKSKMDSPSESPQFEKSCK